MYLYGTCILDDRHHRGKFMHNHSSTHRHTCVDWERPNMINMGVFGWLLLQQTGVTQLGAVDSSSYFRWPGSLCFEYLSALPCTSTAQITAILRRGPWQAWRERLPTWSLSTWLLVAWSAGRNPDSHRSILCSGPPAAPPRVRASFHSLTHHLASTAFAQDTPWWWLPRQPWSQVHPTFLGCNPSQKMSLLVSLTAWASHSAFGCAINQLVDVQENLLQFSNDSCLIFYKHLSWARVFHSCPLLLSAQSVICFPAFDSVICRSLSGPIPSPQLGQSLERPKSRRMLPWRDTDGSRFGTGRKHSFQGAGLISLGLHFVWPTW